MGRSYAALSSVSFCRLQSSVQRDSQTVRPTTPSGSQWPFPHNQPLVSHIFLTFQISTRQSFVASATAGRVAATIHELQLIGGRRVFLSKAMSFASNRPSLFPGLSRWALQAWLELEPRFLRTTASAQVTHVAHTTSRGHCPSSRRVRLINHIERHPKFHHSTSDLQSVSCTLRDRDIFTLCSWQRHNLLRRWIRLD